MKEVFLEQLREGNDIVEFTVPKDAPAYCTGCKNCFFLGADKCPHANKVQPIWNVMLSADLIVFAYPTYVMRAPAQVKTVLDHLGCYWFVHRPNQKMFTKKAFIISHGIGPVHKNAIKDVKTSLNWLGVSHVKSVGFGLMEGIIWDELSAKRKSKITKAIIRKAAKYKHYRPDRIAIKGRMLFFISKLLRKKVYKDELLKSGQAGLDSRYWIEQGWIKEKQLATVKARY